jgi:hypothetical protein
LLRRSSEHANGVEPSSHAGMVKEPAAPAHQQGDLAEANHYYQQELTMRRTLGSTPELVAAMSNLAANWPQQWRYAEAHRIKSCVSGSMPDKLAQTDDPCYTTARHERIRTNNRRRHRIV